MSDTQNPHEVTEEKDTDATSTKNRVEVAWKLILEQYFEHAKKVAAQEGAGISVFRLLRAPKKDVFNCEYYYAEKDGKMWNMLFSFSPDGKFLLEKYDSTRTLAICVQIPVGVSGNSTSGNIRLFSIDTGKEIDLEEETVIEEIEKMTLQDKPAGGVHKRIVRETED